jgi:glycosyltransferase involved in cell wall biosynthesis
MALKKGSFISTRHNSERFLPSGPRVISKILSRYVIHRAFALVSISHAVERFLRETGEVRESDNVVVIHYGLKQVNIKNFDEVFPDKVYYQIGTVARLTRQKNLPLLLNTLRLLHDRGYKEFKLSVVGVGNLSSDLHEMAKTLNLSNSIDWKGKVEDVSSYYGSLDVFIFTSNYEGFGLVLLEAMMHGIPIIARNTSAVPEVLGANHPGLVDSSDPEDFVEKLLQLYNDSSKLKTYLLYQSEQLTKFSIYVTESAHFNLYARLEIEDF